MRGRTVFVDVPDGAGDGEHDGGEALRAGPGRLYDPHGAGERGRLPTGGRQRHTRRARMYVTLEILFCDYDCEPYFQ